ncbi:MAG: flagellar motor switch protein FliG [Spirochaetaceae bacterium]|nr:flagellar motor switch protein FliG [Spirochaetaceae bacterium]
MDFETRRKLDAYKRSAAARADGMIKTGDSGEEPSNDTADRLDGWREAAAAFAKIPYSQLPPEEDEAADKQESKARKVAKFLILIGPDQAAKVLANLDENQVESISREIARIRGITKEEASEIFAEFQGLLSSSLSYGGAAGGIEEARRLLYSAFGPEKGEAFLRRSVPDVTETSFSFLEDFSGEQVAMLLRDELPATGAVILSRISPNLAAKTLTCAEPEWRLEAVRRIGRLGKISPEALEKTAAALREKAHSISGVVTSDVDGMGALAAILKHSAVSFGDRILNELSDEDPDLSNRLKERLYTLDDVIKAENKPIQKKLREMDVHDIAILIKGRNEAFTEKILSNISTRRRAEVQDELSFMGLIPKKDADAAIKNFMDWFRRERDSGQILMIGDELVS